MAQPKPSLTPALDQLRSKTGKSWDNLQKAEVAAVECRDRIAEAVSGKGVVPPDTALVVFGSVARNERTQGSDCDWTLLVDGQAIGAHHTCALEISKKLAELNLAEPGITGLFGSLAFSHELVHQIGGEEDTNRNTTRRILLLLESQPIAGDTSTLVRQRVVRQIIHRYLEQEPDLLSPDGERRFPRFLLNDIVRYWRTMAVDYARKVRDRQSRGWAIRNIKLRLSRKLTFVSGMLNCFECVLRPKAGPSDSLFGSEHTRLLSVQEHILANVELPPIEVLARAVGHYSPTEPQLKSLATQLFDSYDAFLGMLNDKEARNALSALPPERAEQDKTFQSARSLGKQFQNGLLELFFNSDGDLTKATQEYGVF